MHIMERVDITSKNDQEIAEIIRKKFVKQFSRIYPFSNENLEFLCERRYLEGKIAVTVGSSLDQGFEMLYNGAKEVTVCDVCPSTEDYYELFRI